MATNFFGKIVYGTQPKNFANTNNAVLDASYGTSKLYCKPIYGNDQVTPIYYEYTLSVETVIYEWETEDASLDMEDEVERLKLILGKPGLKLMIYPVGLSNIPIVNGVDPGDLGNDSQGNEYPDLGVSPDPTGGPFPQVVSIAPFAGNRAIYVRWEVMFRIQHCIFGVYNTDEAYELSIESDFDVDDEGDVRYTLIGTYRHVGQTLDGQSTVTTPLLMDFRAWMLAGLTDDGLGAFNFTNQWTGFNMRSKMSVSRDKRTATFTIVMDPIKSPHAYFSSAHQISATDVLGSDLQNGFFQWTRNLQVTVTLRASHAKYSAWLIFLRIIQQRMRYVTLINDVALVQDKDVVNAEEANKKVASKYLLLSVQLTDEIYTRTMKFNATFVIFSTLKKILRASNIFGKINNSYDVVENDRKGLGSIICDAHKPSSLKDQWARWSLASTYQPRGNTRPSMVRGIFDVCGASFDAPILIHQRMFTPDPQAYPNNSANPSTQYPLGTGETTARTPYPGQQADIDAGFNADPLQGVHKALICGSVTPADEITYFPEAADNWVDYQTEIVLIEDTNNIPIRYLNGYDIAGYHSSDTLNTGKLYTKFAINNQVTPTDHLLPGDAYTSGTPYTDRFHTISRGAPRFYILFTGYAVRVMDQIPIPSLIAFNLVPNIADSANYKPVVRVGKPMTSHRQVGSSPNPLYVAKWRIMYTIDEDVRRENILARLLANTDQSIVMR